jgi:hypothetical protein
MNETHMIFDESTTSTVMRCVEVEVVREEIFPSQIQMRVGNLCVNLAISDGRIELELVPMGSTINPDGTHDHERSPQYENIIKKIDLTEAADTDYPPQDLRSKFDK